MHSASLPSTDERAGSEEKISLARWAAREIERRINSDEYRVGERLPAQRDLAATMRVSRTVLREAISVLEARGLLRSHGGSGTFVIGRELAQELQAGAVIKLSDTYSKLDFCRFRLAIEVSCIRLAAMKVTEDDIDILTRNLQQFREAIRVGRFDQAATLDADFHFLIVKTAGVLLFTDLYRSFNAILVETIAMQPAVQSRGWEAFVEHERVLEALRRRDPQESVYYLQSHITRAAERLGYVLPTEIL